MNAVLGIDGGGTRTRASLVAGDKVLAFAENGSIKRLRVGEEAAEENLRAILKDAYSQAGLPCVDRSRACRVPEGYPAGRRQACGRESHRDR